MIMGVPTAEMDMNTRRGRRMRTRYERPNDLIVLLIIVSGWLSSAFAFSFSWVTILQERREEKRLDRLSQEESRDETFSNIMNEDGDDPEQFARMMRGEDSQVERRLYVEIRGRELLTMIASILVMVLICLFFAGLITIFSVFGLRPLLTHFFPGDARL